MEKDYCKPINWTTISRLISHATKKNTIPCKDKWLSNTNIYKNWSNLLWDAPLGLLMQITQTLKFKSRRYLGNYRKKHALKQDISSACNLCTSAQNDICLHLLSCCVKSTHKQSKDKSTQQSNTCILLAHPTTCCFTLINTSNIEDRALDNTVPSWLLPCICYTLYSLIWDFFGILRQLQI